MAADVVDTVTIAESVNAGISLGLSVYDIMAVGEFVSGSPAAHSYLRVDLEILKPTISLEVLWNA